MNNTEFAAKCRNIAENYNTLYVMGCFGAPLTGSNVTRYLSNHSYNQNPARQAMIRAAADKTPPVFGFDCVCLIKGVLWGWNGNANHVYGGASYGSNGVPDIGADQMINVCSGVSSDFSEIEIGEALWVSGHIGVYIGGGLAVECTPAFANKVQITAVANRGGKSGYNSRSWAKHGKLPYIQYVKQTTEPEPQPTPEPAPAQPENPAAPVETVTIKAGEIVRFKGGSVYYASDAKAAGGSSAASLAKVTAYVPGRPHPAHLRAVNAAGEYIFGVYGWVDLSAIDGGATAPEPEPAQPTPEPESETVEELARAVIAGKYGNGLTRRLKLGALYDSVQKRVNEILRG